MELKYAPIENSDKPAHPRNLIRVFSVCCKENMGCTRVLQKVLSLGSDYFSATFYQTYFYSVKSRTSLKPGKIG